MEPWLHRGFSSIVLTLWSDLMWRLRSRLRLRFRLRFNILRRCLSLLRWRFHCININYHRSRPISLNLYQTPIPKRKPKERDLDLRKSRKRERESFRPDFCRKREGEEAWSTRRWFACELRHVVEKEGWVRSGHGQWRVRDSIHWVWRKREFEISHSV